MCVVEMGERNEGWRWELGRMGMKLESCHSKWEMRGKKESREDGNKDGNMQFKKEMRDRKRVKWDRFILRRNEGEMSWNDRNAVEARIMSHWIKMREKSIRIIEKKVNWLGHNPHVTQKRNERDETESHELCRNHVTRKRKWEGNKTKENSNETRWQKTESCHLKGKGRKKEMRKIGI